MDALQAFAALLTLAESSISCAQFETAAGSEVVSPDGQDLRIQVRTTSLSAATTVQTTMNEVEGDPALLLPSLSYQTFEAAFGWQLQFRQFTPVPSPPPSPPASLAPTWSAPALPGPAAPTSTPAPSLVLDDDNATTFLTSGLDGICGVGKLGISRTDMVALTTPLLLAVLITCSLLLLRSSCKRPALMNAMLFGCVNLATDGWFVKQMAQRAFVPCPMEGSACADIEMPGSLACNEVYGLAGRNCFVTVCGDAVEEQCCPRMCGSVCTSSDRDVVGAALALIAFFMPMACMLVFINRSVLHQPKLYSEVDAYRQPIIYYTIILLSFLNADILSVIPWMRESADGFPSKSLRSYAFALQFLHHGPLLGLQVFVFLRDKDFLGAQQHAPMSELLLVLSILISFVSLAWRVVIRATLGVFDVTDEAGNQLTCQLDARASLDEITLEDSISSKEESELPSLPGVRALDLNALISKDTSVAAAREELNSVQRKVAELKANIAELRANGLAADSEESGGLDSDAAGFCNGFEGFEKETAGTETREERLTRRKESMRAGDGALDLTSGKERPPTRRLRSGDSSRFSEAARAASARSTVERSPSFPNAVSAAKAESMLEAVAEADAPTSETREERLTRRKESMRAGDGALDLTSGKERPPTRRLRSGDSSRFSEAARAASARSTVERSPSFPNAVDAATVQALLDDGPTPDAPSDAAAASSAAAERLRLQKTVAAEKFAANAKSAKARELRDRLAAARCRLKELQLLHHTEEGTRGQRRCSVTPAPAAANEAWITLGQVSQAKGQLKACENGELSSSAAYRSRLSRAQMGNASRRKSSLTAASNLQSETNARVVRERLAAARERLAELQRAREADERDGDGLTVSAHDHRDTADEVEQRLSAARKRLAELQQASSKTSPSEATQEGAVMTVARFASVRELPDADTKGRRGSDFEAMIHEDSCTGGDKSTPERRVLKRSQQDAAKTIQRIQRGHAARHRVHRGSNAAEFMETRASQRGTKERAGHGLSPSHAAAALSAAARLKRMQEKQQKRRGASS